MKTRVEKVFRLRDRTMKSILDILKPRRQLLFPKPFGSHCSSLYERLRFILRSAGLPCTRRDMFHKFRRTTATQIAMVAGESLASQHLGHEDASTIKRYIDPRFTSQTDLALKLPSFSWEEPVEITIQPLAKPEPLPPAITYKVTQDDLVGAGVDPIIRLSHQEQWLAGDLCEAMTTIGITPERLAIEASLQLKHLRRVLRRGGLISKEMTSRLRAALGIVSDWRGHGKRSLRNEHLEGGAA